MEIMDSMDALELTPSRGLTQISPLNTVFSHPIGFEVRRLSIELRVRGLYYIVCSRLGQFSSTRLRPTSILEVRSRSVKSKETGILAVTGVRLDLNLLTSYLTTPYCTEGASCCLTSDQVAGKLKKGKWVGL